jgi:hypothetical protein
VIGNARPGTIWSKLGKSYEPVASARGAEEDGGITPHEPPPRECARATRLDCALQNEINLAAEQFLEKIFQIHVAVERLLGKLDQKIDVTLRPGISRA